MFEKYDGIRGFWNPHQKTFFSRTGKPFLFPSHIISMMPNVMLDGELWYEFHIQSLLPINSLGLGEAHFKKPCNLQVV
jgi:hypothetical protein